MTVLKKNVVALFFVVFAMLGIGLFAVSASAEEPNGKITVYSEEGITLAEFDTWEDLLNSEYAPNMISTVAESCDTEGHVHGSKTYYLEYGDASGSKRYICCWWCGALIGYEEF